MVNIQTADIMSDYFSTYSRNVRVVAWILRFIHNISNVNKLRGNLVYEEFKKAENLVFKSMQLRSFQDEKFLAKMQAFKDEEGLLRIRTKLGDSDEKEDFKFPVLLPANDVVVKLIREEHKKAMHAGSYILLARLSEIFWIIKAKKLVKQVLNECVTCKRYKSKHVEVPFAPLSRERVTQTKIFEKLEKRNSSLDVVLNSIQIYLVKKDYPKRLGHKSINTVKKLSQRYKTIAYTDGSYDKSLNKRCACILFILLDGEITSQKVSSGSIASNYDRELITIKETLFLPYELGY
ncbi:integrase_H2C2 domain-containing protein [Nephila pilipes]|uniref:Integrase_H2C2 domain-containing protein n=1 Tax=Nephila pilipes TaxID=299642 RepID=A0A8X6Q4V8_NEPPI|nr:integrase_H2C2 domain-containing protein [Nephila pilipes]